MPSIDPVQASQSWALNQKIRVAIICLSSASLQTILIFHLSQLLIVTDLRLATVLRFVGRQPAFFHQYLLLKLILSLLPTYQKIPLKIKSDIDMISLQRLLQSEWKFVIFSLPIEWGGVVCVCVGLWCKRKLMSVGGWWKEKIRNKRIWR